MNTVTKTPPRTALVTGARDGEALWFRDNRMTIKAREADTGGAYALVEAWAPAGSGPPLHIHHSDDEAFWVLSGRLVMRCGEDEFLAGSGDFVFLPRGVPHTFRVEDEGDARMLVVLSPGGGERLFELAGAPAEGPGLPPPSPPDMSALIRAAEQVGNEIIGPPMTADSVRGR
jgi:mannose-6-phosphate isomerase-like protein (cupin superfamily)